MTSNTRGCIRCESTGAPTIARVRSPYLGYDLMICHACGRYLKALDARKSSRPLLPYADPIVTLPLDAAVMRRRT